MKSVKDKRRVKVFGLDSTGAIRNRLIEILYERVAYHKDKFVAPILHHEMQSMEVKKNGKVEHSDNSHDDQVFSYLMALYVWYDGKNLAENFHIIKNTIKTDQDEDFEELEIEDSIEKVEKVDFESTLYEPDSEILKDLEWIEANTKYITSADLRTEQYIQKIQQRDLVLSTNKEAREAYCNETGTDSKMYNTNGGIAYVTLPDTLFLDNNDFLDEDTEKRNSVLAGNLAEWWDKI